MSTITKEQIEQYANAARLIQVSDFDKGKLITVAPDHMLELARNALASLEAEPVGEVSEQRDGLVMDGTVDLGGASTHRIIKGASKMKRLPLGTKFYTTPPAPANAEPVAWLWSHRKHPSEVSIVRPEDDERAEGAHWSGWSCQALYAAPPAPVSVPDALEDDIHSDDHPLLWSYNNGWNACRSAMLQGVENGESATTMKTAPALDSSPKIDESPSGNSPVIPDGWVMVPVEPTYQMCKAMGLPWESPRFPDLYKAMIAAAPHFREISNSSTKHFRENAETSTKCWCHTCRPVTNSDMRFVVCPDCGNKRCPHANDHRNACTGSNEPGQEGSAYPAGLQQEVK